MTGPVAADTLRRIADRDEPRNGADELLVAPRPASPAPKEFLHLVILLARRETDSRQRTTLLGWAWPVTRQLAQLAVLVFVFSKVLPVGIDNFAVFVFTGLIVWNWFSGGVATGASSLLANRHLVFQARFPTLVLPIVSIAVQFVDLLFAVPILVVLLLATGELHATALLVPIPLVAQFLLMAGLVWTLSPAAVFLRDIPAVVGVAMTLLFYMTPVFYALSNVPERYRSVLELNPLTTMLEVHRALLLGDQMPSAARLAVVGICILLTAAVGYRLFRKLQPRVVDYL